MSGQSEVAAREGVYRWSQTPLDPMELWEAEDYSWAGLAKKAWKGPAGCSSLQDYWRLDPTTGKIRSDAALRRSGELVTTPTGVDFCIHHLSNALLATFPKARQRAIKTRKASGVRARLLAARRVDAFVFGKDFHIDGEDTRAQFQGVWFERGSFMSAREINAVFRGSFLFDASFPRRTLFGPATDFRDAWFNNPATFVGCRFAMVSFDRARFYSGASFANAWFLDIAFFNEAWFEVEADFEGARFKSVLDFYKAVFVNVADFSGVRCWNFGAGEAVFLNKTRFEEAWVKSGADFNKAYICGDSSFNGAKFGPHTNFEGAHFASTFESGGMLKANRVGGLVDFSKARFGPFANFANSVFGGRADFVFSVFQPSGSFHGAWFQDDVDFTASALGRAMRFDRATFDGRAFFAAMEHDSLAGGIAKELNFAPSSAEFHAIDFSNATFDNLASFPGRKFQEEVSFENAIWRGSLNFAGTTFRHDANFENVRFANSDRSLWPGPWSAKRLWWPWAWSKRGQIKTGFPTLAAFDASRLARATTCTVPLEPLGLGMIARRCNPRGLKGSGHTDWRGVRKAVGIQYGEQERAFRALRAALGNAAVRVGENRLFELEMTARYRRPNASNMSVFERGLGRLYEVTSGFGQSLVRPLVAWLALMALSLSIYWALGKATLPELLSHLPMPGRTEVDPDIWRALQVSLSSAFKPFEAWGSGYERQFAPPMTPDVAWLAHVTQTWPLVSRLWSSTVSILSLSVLFLFGLAVKRRFQVP